MVIPKHPPSKATPTSLAVLTLSLVPEISLPAHLELVGRHGTHIPRDVVTHALNKKHFHCNKQLREIIKDTPGGKVRCHHGHKTTYIGLDPVHCARVEPDHFAHLLSEPVHWDVPTFQVTQNWPPGPYKKQTKTNKKQKQQQQKKNNK